MGPPRSTSALAGVLTAFALLTTGTGVRADPDDSADVARRPANAILLSPRAQTLPGTGGTLRRLYRPEFRSAEWLREALLRYGVPEPAAALVAPWTDELRPPPAPPGSPPLAEQPLLWPTERWDQRLDEWLALQRKAYQPFRAATRLLLQGPPADVAHWEQALVNLDVPAPSVAVGITIAEVRVETRRQRGGHLLFSREAAPESPDTFFRGSSADFEPDAFIRSRITGLIPFPGTSVTFQRFEETDGLFEYVLRGMAVKQEAELLAQPCLVCTEESPCGLESVAEIPALTLVQDPWSPVPRIEVRPLGAGIRLGLKAVRVGADSAVLDLKVELRTAEPNPEPDALPGTFVLRRRELSTRVTVRDGESIVLGGLTLTRGLSDRRGMPLLSAVPALDAGTSARNAAHRRSELLFVLSPRLLAVGRPAAHGDGTGFPCACGKAARAYEAPACECGSVAPARSPAGHPPTPPGPPASR